MSVGSVWDWERLEYDYYKVPGSANLGGFEQLDGLGISKKPTPAGSMGIDIEDALPKLPRGSSKIGSGVQARGRIYRHEGYFRRKVNSCQYFDLRVSYTRLH